MKGIVINKPKGFEWSGTNDNLSKEIILKFKKRSKLGNLLKIKKQKSQKVPEGMRVKSIENNSPSVGKIKIKFVKK